MIIVLGFFFKKFLFGIFLLERDEVSSKDEVKNVVLLLMVKGKR